MPSPSSVLKIRRTKLTSAGTWGKAELWRGPLCMFRCHTLELPWKDNRRGISCIPDGLYDMALTMSPRFGTRLWEVLDVPNLYKARSASPNYLRVRPLTRFGAPARGAVVKAEYGGRVRVKGVCAGSGYLCQMEPVAHFGLGESRTADRVTVTWPDGSGVTLLNPGGNRTLNVPYPRG